MDLDIKRHVAQSLKSIFHGIQKVADKDLEASLRDVARWDDRVFRSVYAGMVEDAPGGADSFEAAFHAKVCAHASCAPAPAEAESFFRACMLASARELLADPARLRDRTDEGRHRLKRLYYGACRAALADARAAHAAAPERFTFEGKVFETLPETAEDDDVRTVEVSPDPDPAPEPKTPRERRTRLPTRRLRAPDVRTVRIT